MPNLWLPPRLARLTVEMGDSGIASVVTCNVACFSVEATRLTSQIRRLDIDGCTLSIPDDDGSADDSRLHYFQRDDSGRWGVGGSLLTKPALRTQAKSPAIDPRRCRRRRVATGTTALQEPIFDLAFSRTAQNRRVRRRLVRLRNVDRATARERPVHVLQAGCRHRPRNGNPRGGAI
jgi:hypothetical protein